HLRNLLPFQKLRNIIYGPKEKTMKNARSLVAAVVLTFVIAASVLAGETPTPPCTPGQIDTPPCAMAQASSIGEPTATAPGEILTPPMANDQAYLTEIASSVLLSIVSLF
ncbi:MAG: hypothetical protein ACMG6H_05270, partial [Acidobacteriota bacterium]